MHASDHELIAACRGGDARAWNALLERYVRLVTAIPRRYGLDVSDCDDVAQGVFLALFRALDSLADESRLSSWLITTAHRVSWRVGRKSNRYPQLPENMPDVSAPETDDVTRWERQQGVREALSELGGTCEQLLAQLFIGPVEPSYQLIAERLGMAIGSIGPTRARCLAKLERILRNRGFDGVD